MTLVNTCCEEEDAGSGAIRRTIHMRPVAYRDGSLLRRIDTRFGASGIAERPHIISGSALMVSVGDDGARRLHPTRELDRYISISAPLIKPAAVWRSVGFSGATRTANRITWTRPEAALSILHAGHYCKLDIELLGGYVPPSRQFAFNVVLVGLTRQGAQILADGVPVAILRAPHVEDAANPEDVRPVAWEFTPVAGKPGVVFTLPDLSGMRRPLVDPTLTLQPDAAAGQDTAIRSDNPATNTGTSVNLPLGFAAQTWRILIKFDLSTLPDTTVISSTTLRLRANADFSTNARTFRIYRLKRAWAELQATWNQYTTGNAWATAGAFGATDCEQTDIGSRDFTATETLNEFKDFTLTPTTKTALDLGNGWLGKADTEVNDAYQFDSSDNATPANRPQLVTVYTMSNFQPGQRRSVGLAGSVSVGGRTRAAGSKW